MDIAIVTPEPTSDTAGNETTSARWQRILEELGHRVRVAYDFEPERSTPDALVALHAHKSHDSIERFEQHHPDRPLIVALTGTDLYEYRHRADRVDRNIGRADALVALQPRAADELPTSARDRLHVAYQSVGLLADTEQFRRSPSFPDADERFDVLVAAHLRDVKDPLRTARAAARLPDDSDLRVRHVGSARSEDWADRAREAENRQPRFQWLGEIPRPEALERIGAADLLTVTSVLEGGPNVVSEAVALGTPVVASRIPGNIGLLGEDYPGLVEPESTEALADELHRAESDPDYYRELCEACEAVRDRFDPHRERRAWRAILADVGLESSE